MNTDYIKNLVDGINDESLCCILGMTYDEVKNLCCVNFGDAVPSVKGELLNVSCLPSESALYPKGSKEDVLAKIKLIKIVTYFSPVVC